eukprot:1869370-Rhodomonas_salina.1
MDFARRSTPAEMCARQKALFLQKIAQDLAVWQAKVDECTGNLEEHRCEVELHAAYLQQRQHVTWGIVVLFFSTGAFR